MTAIVTLVTVVFAALAVVLALSGRRQLRADIEQRTLNHAALATGAISDAYSTYYFSGFSKFRELVSDVMARNPDLVRIAIYDTNGVLLFDSVELGDAYGAPRARPGPRTEKPRLRRAVRGLEPAAWHVGPESGPGEERFLVVYPHVEEWGRHRYSVAYWASYASLGEETWEMLGRLLGPILASLVLGLGVAVFLARQSLGPLEKLAAGARDLARGDLDRRLDVRTGDEFEALADTFNDMAERLAVTIHDLEASNEALARSNVHLREVDRLKSDLLANVSHELRTPLTSLRGYNEAMAEGILGPLTDSQREALEVSGRNLERLQEMIDGLLTYSRLESGAIEIEREEIDLLEIARASLMEIRSARAPGRTLDLEAPEELPTVWADPQRIRQVLENLLSNAVKFTAEDERVLLRLRAERHDVVVEVIDEGIGIAAEDRSRIFERFYQVDSSSTRAFGGIGLGLAIVRQILDAHGVRIEVESELGKGSLFRFRLPRPPEDGEEALAPSVAVVGGAPEWVGELQEELIDRGWRVRTTDSCAAGRRLVAEMMPSVVVLDRLLEDGDGFDLLSEWQRAAAIRRIPVVVVSTPRDRSLARRIGAAVHLSKPASPERVADEIEGVEVPDDDPE